MPPTTPGFQRVRRSAGSTVNAALVAFALLDGSVTASETAPTTRTTDFDKRTLFPLPSAPVRSPWFCVIRPAKNAVESRNRCSVTHSAISKPLQWCGHSVEKQQHWIPLPAAEAGCLTWSYLNDSGEKSSTQHSPNSRSLRRVIASCASCVPAQLAVDLSLGPQLLDLADAPESKTFEVLHGDSRLAERLVQLARAVRVLPLPSSLRAG